MSKILKTLRDLFSFVFIAVFSFIITGCAGTENLPANKWLTVTKADGYLYNSENNKDKSVDARDLGFSTDTMSNDEEWDTPYLRYSYIQLEVNQKTDILGMAFEIKGESNDGFNLNIEIQLYKNISFPSNWEELTEEAQMIWESQNRIKDRQKTTVFVSRQLNAVSVSFNESEVSVDDSYDIRIYFTYPEDESSNEEENEHSLNKNFLKNFAIDNFIVITEGVE